MVEEDRAALIVEVGIGEDHRTGGRSHDWRADRCGHVIALMDGDGFARLAGYLADADIFPRRAEGR